MATNKFRVKKGLIVEGSGSVILDVQGSQGQLFSITDQLTGSLFSVNDISGLPILEVTSDDTVTMGTFGAEALTISGSDAYFLNGNVGIGTVSPLAKLHIEGLASQTQGLMYINNTYANAGVFYPALKVVNDRGIHSYGVVAEFRINNSTDLDRPALMFSKGGTSVNWRIGMGVYNSNVDNFTIGYNGTYPINSFSTSYLTITTGGNVLIGTTTDNGNKLRVNGTVFIDTISAATTDTDRFIVSDGGQLKYRTGTQLLSDIGGAASSHTHTPSQVGLGNVLNVEQVPARVRTTWNDSPSVIDKVIGQLAWKNYSNNHTIFDASAGTSPNGTSINNTNSQVAWTGTYPTLMGWNGSSTYGVRVDSARVSDNTAGNAATATTLQTTRTIWGQNFNGSANVSGALSGATTISMSGQLTNTVAAGTAPFVINSTTRVANLNVASAGTADTSVLLSASGTMTSQYGDGRIGYPYAIALSTTGLFSTTDNSNAIITINRHPGNYYSQLGFNSIGGIFYRSFQNIAINTTLAWQRIFMDNYHPNADTWTTARTLTIGSTGKSVNGSANVSWSLAEIGAQAALTNPVTGTGTTNYVPKFTGTSIIGNSVLYETSGGNLGAGTTDPVNFTSSRTFEIYGGTTAGAFIASSNTRSVIGEVQANGANNALFIGTRTASALVFRINTSEFARFFTNGNFVIGSQTDQGYKFAVVGTVGITSSLTVDNVIRSFSQIVSEGTAKGNSGTGTVTFNWDQGNIQTVTLTGSCTFAFSNPRGKNTYQIIITQDATGSRTITWPTIKWEGGSAPSLTGTANSRDIVTLSYDGSSYYGVIAKNFA